MQVTENISRIDGCIMARSPSEERQDWDDLTVRLERLPRRWMTAPSCCTSGSVPTSSSAFRGSSRRGQAR